MTENERIELDCWQLVVDLFGASVMTDEEYSRYLTLLKLHPEGRVL